MDEPVSAPAIAAAGLVRANDSISGTACQRRKSSTKIPSSSALARMAKGPGAASTASIAAAANPTSSAEKACRTTTAPARR